ncbi:hypothetical protein BH11CYA1_BH11CYA1_46940 [soil metagenome]
MNKPSFNLFISAAIALSLFALTAGHFTVHQLAMAPEPAMRLSCGMQIASGARPYLDFLDNSSPFALYLASLPALISKIIFVHPICITNLLVVALTLISLLMLLASSRGRPRLRLLQYYLPAVFAGVALTQYYFLQYFASESVLFFLLFLPYLTQRYLSLSAAAAKTKNAFLPILTGFCAALALLLNPIYLAALLSVEFTCLFSLGDLSLTKIRRRYFTTELKACLVSLLLLCLVLLCLAPMVVREYLGPICQINQLAFEYFNDDLAFVGKSPDRRDLVYTFVVFFVLSLPVAGRCLLTRLMCLMAAYGFGCFVFSATLFTDKGILMIGYSLVALLLAAVRYVRSYKPAKRFLASLVSLAEGQLVPRILQVLSICTIVCFVGSYYAANKSTTGNTFSLKELGYYGFGLERDLSFFSKTVRHDSAVRDLVWIYSEQVSPAFPLLTQLRRHSGYLVWGFPLHTLKILHQRGTPAQIEKLANFEATMFNRLRIEALSPHPPTLVLIEDGEVRDLFKANGITAIIEQNYTSIDSCSPLNGDEIASHDPYEYLGYRVSFSTDKLKLDK